MNLLGASVFLLIAFGAVSCNDCYSKRSNSNLFCYYGKSKDINNCMCSHVILPENSDIKSLDNVRDKFGSAKIMLTVNDFNEDLVNTLKSNKVDGLEINLKKLDSKTDITDFIETVRSKLGSELYLAISVPASTEKLAKYYDFKALSKYADVFILQTNLLGVSKNVTFHPSRLSGLWDVQNTDSVVDLVSGLGAPLSKLVITAPVQAFKFTLQSEEHTAPGSPAVELSTLTRDQLCERMSSDEWTLERDQDQAGPYVFRDKEWIAFEDSISVDIKAKYSRVRGLAGIALKDLSQDGGSKCGESLLEAAFNGISKQARAPRGAVLHSLEREILDASPRQLDNVQVSPYRISRVIDVEGKLHVIRQDTRTEFQCSRQGYFVHPRSCGRFYRCVKFDQLSNEFSVFEFDCPAGLAFDERVEVCVWPGSLPHASACSGSSEIAPVPKERFICPGEPGYYADPENCRWFFACLDHGNTPLSAYEFRCPYGLVYDQERLLCEWPWLVPKCSSGVAAGGDIYGNEYNYGLESRSGDFELNLFNGLGELKGIKLGGLNGPIEKANLKTYHGYGGENTLNSGILQQQLSLQGGVSSGGNYQYSSNPGLYQNVVGATGQVGTTDYFGQSTNLENLHRIQNYEKSNSEDLGLSSIRDSSGDYHHVEVPYIHQEGKQVGYKHEEGNVEAYIHESGGLGNSNIYNSDNYNAENAGSYHNHEAVVTNNFHDKENSFQNYNHELRAYNNQNEANSGSYHHVTNVGISSNRGEDDSARYHVSNIATYKNDGAQIDSQLHLHKENSGKIDIVAGGYSGVSSGIEISQHSVSLGNEENVTPIPIVSSTIPSVTSVPIPVSLTNFGIYKEGVVANLPNLQYKLESPSVINANLNSYNNNYKDLLTGLKLTPRPPIVKTASNYGTIQGYNYVKPAVTFEEGSTKVGYNNIAKIIPVDNNPVKTYSLFEQQIKPITELKSAAIESYSYQKPQQVIFKGYDYPKPNIAFEETPLQPAVLSTYTYENKQPVSKQSAFTYQNIQHTLPSVNLKIDQGYHYEKPAIRFEEKPLIVKEEASKQAAFTYQNIQHTLPSVNLKIDQGYHYEKPTIAFEEKPLIVKEAGYHYEKPAIKFEEKPLIVKEEASKQAAFTYQNIQHTLPSVNLKIDQGYHYEKPTIAFEEKPLIVKEEGYHYEKPVIKFEEKPLIVKEEGYHYEKPTIKFEEKPLIIKEEGYHYEKPAIKFEDKPQIIRPTYQQVKPENPITNTYQESYVINNHENAFEGKSLIFRNPEVISQKVVQPAVTYQEVNVQHQPLLLKAHQPKQILLQEQVHQHHYVQPDITLGTVEHNIEPLVNQDIKIKQAEGYHYQKPTIAFEEKSVNQYQPNPNELRAPLTYQEIKIEKPITNYQKVTHESYPAIKLEAKSNVQIQQPTILLHPTVTYQNIHSTKQDVAYNQVNGGSYHYEKPIIKTEHKPVLIQQEIVQPTKVYQEVFQKPIAQQQHVQYEGYHYDKPSIKFEEKLIEHQQKAIHVQPAVTYQEIKLQRPAIVHQEFKDQTYVKAADLSLNQYQQQPVAEITHVKPTVTYQEIRNEKPVTAYEEVKHVAYNYEKPAAIFNTKIENIAQPVVTYHEVKQIRPEISYQQVQQVQPQISFHGAQQSVSIEHKSTYNEATQARPVVSTYAIPQPTQQTGYIYEKPLVAFEEKPIVTNYSLVKNYIPPKPSSTKIHFAKPTTFIKSSQLTPLYLPAPQPSETYLPISQQSPTYLPVPISQPTASVPKPFVIKTPEFHIPVTQQTLNIEPDFGINFGDKQNYEEPIISKKIQKTYTTQRPTYSSTLASIVAKIEPVPLKYYSYGSELKQQNEFYVPTTENYPKLVVTQSKPIARYEFSSFDSQYNNYAPKPEVVYVSSTVRPNIEIEVPDRKYIQLETPKPSYLPVTRKPIRRPTTAKYIYPTTENYVEITNGYNDYSQTSEIYKIKKPETPNREYLPVTSEKPTKEYLPVTRKPNREYLPVTTIKQSKEYSTIAPRKSNREYLPAKVDKQVENYQIADGYVSTRRPKVIKVKKSKTIVKVNDFHPILSAKLGAQCTCVSNTLTLRKKPKNNYDNLSNKGDIELETLNNKGDIELENYSYQDDESYESQKVVEVSTRQPSTAVYVEEPVTKVVELFAKKSRRPTIIVVDENEDIDVKGTNKDILSVVDSGSKQVKSSVRQGVERVKEVVVTKNFDRYGPGGLRGRSETLQGTVDCQRAGLFRHPTHCNKFYACRWDCTKKKFTLHVFNCPIHLTFDNNLGACNWPSQGPACVDNTLLPTV